MQSGSKYRERVSSMRRARRSVTDESLLRRGVDLCRPSDLETMESMTNSRSPVLEIPVDDPATARAAASHADRLEVCRDLEAEGLTPSPEFLAEIVAASREEGHRPEIAVVFQELPPPEDRRIVGPADFRARPEDLRRLAELAPAFAAAGAGSVVLGFADEDGLPDEVAVAEAVRIVARHGMQLAFHRAFDLADDPAEAARRLESLGVDRTLAAGSSGYDASVATIDQRVERLAAAATAIDPGRFAIVPCGGVRSSNLASFLAVTPHAHASCRIRPTAFELGRFDGDEAARLRGLVHS